MNQFVDTTEPVRTGEELDVARLEPYVRSVFPDAADELVVEQFPKGHSNLTYLVRVGEDDFVLRRPPFGNVVKAAHDMGREYRVLSRLWNIYPLAPRAFAYCEDESILGAPFYLMERRRGVVLRHPLPPGLDLAPGQVRALSEALTDNLAHLHLLDYPSVGLADLGKPDGYVERQISGWIQRYHNAQTDDVPALERVADWLASNRPGESGAALIHNDYKYDNVLLDASDLTRLVAVLDWEMATVGDPPMDLGTSLAYWIEPDDPDSAQALAFGPTHLAGGLTRRELIERYEEKTRRRIKLAHFYYAYGLFKTAVIIQQIYARYVRGHTRDERFANFNRNVAALGEIALRVVQSRHV